MIENVCSELRKYLEGKPILSSMLGFDKIILYVAAAFMLLSSIVYFGGFLNALFFYVFILGIVLCLADRQFRALTIGLAADALAAIINLFKGFFSEFGFYVNWNALLALLVFGFFAYEAYKKTLKKA